MHVTGEALAATSDVEHLRPSVRFPIPIAGQLDDDGTGIAAARVGGR
jgi:hypothetical protein